MDWFGQLAEQRIQEAIERGVFDDLPGAGRPVDLEDWSRVPEELRASYTLLKANGFVPDELDARKECLRLQDLIDAANASDGGTERGDALAAELRRAELRYRMLLECRGWTPALAGYRDRVAERLGGAAEPAASEPPRQPAG
jgi:hypothetical protein